MNTKSTKNSLFALLRRQAIIAATAAGLVAPLLAGDGAQHAFACDIGNWLSGSCDRPGAPTAVKVNARIDSATVSWNLSGGFNSDGIPTASVMVKANGRDQGTRSLPVADGRSIVVDQLNPGTFYCFAVALTGGNGLVSGYSDWACDTTRVPLFSNAPATPLTVDAVPGNIHLLDFSGSGIRIGWSFPHGYHTPNAFTIYRDGQRVGSAQPSATDDNSYTDAFSPSRLGYTYKVCASYSQGDLGPVEDCSEAIIKQDLTLLGAAQSPLGNTVRTSLNPILPPSGH